MEVKHQEITLDLNDNRNYTLLKAHQGDRGTRFIDVSLKHSGEDFILQENYTAIVKASNNGVTKGLNQCEIDIENNKVIVELTDTMLDTAGVLTCEISILENRQIVTSQIFSINVVLSAVTDEEGITKSEVYGYLVELLKKNAEIADEAKFIEDIIENFGTVTDVSQILEQVRLNSQSVSFLTEKTEELDSIKADKTSVPTKLSELDNDKHFMESVEVRGTDFTKEPAIINRIQNEAGHLVLYTSKMFSQDAGDNTAYSGNMIEDKLSEKENISNKVNAIYFPSSNYYPTAGAVWNFVESREQPFNETLQMLLPSVMRTVTGQNVVSLSSTAQDGLIRVEGENVVVKNKNIYEYTPPSAISKCSVSVEGDSYVVTPQITSGDNNFYFFNTVMTPKTLYNEHFGKLFTYGEDMKISLSDSFFNRTFITYFDEEMRSITAKEVKNKTVIEVEKIENCKFITLRFGWIDLSDFDIDAVNQTRTLKVQVEYGPATDYVTPQVNTSDTLGYDGTTNVFADGSVTAQYIPKLF